MIPIDVDKKTARMPWGGAETGAEEGADTAVRDQGRGVSFELLLRTDGSSARSKQR